MPSTKIIKVLGAMNGNASMSEADLAKELVAASVSGDQESLFCLSYPALDGLL